MAPSDTRSGADAPTTPAQALGVATALFERLHADGIAYCLWKSNEHLSAAMTGATDLDVLVDRDAALRMGGLLSELGYKRVTATPRHAYAGIEDYLALDRPTGRLAHLHLHYQLTLGEKNVKGYRLPWEDLVLDSRVLNREYGVFTTEPTLELVLLVVRSALRLRTRDMVSGNREAPAFRDAGRREFEWLVAQTDQARVRELTERLLGPAAAAALAAMLHRPPTIGSLYAFRRLILPAFADFRIYGRLRALRYRWSRELALRWEKARRRLLGFPRPYKHTLPRGGLIVVFVGCDGSGKSTVTREITRWLSWKLDVAQLYFGSGNGPA
ncbi:MAG TPA: hypothetical protein VNK43_10040, partial [Gemmatimonadales bacterium]|nr:hypothetical protein [Gemmatimonadales bacterium]